MGSYPFVPVCVKWPPAGSRGCPTARPPPPSRSSDESPGSREGPPKSMTLGRGACQGQSCMSLHARGAVRGRKGTRSCCFRQSRQGAPNLGGCVCLGTHRAAGGGGCFCRCVHLYLHPPIKTLWWASHSNIGLPLAAKMTLNTSQNPQKPFGRGQ